MPLALCVCSVITIAIASVVVNRKVYTQAEADMANSIEKQADAVKVALEGQYALLRTQADTFSRYGYSSEPDQKTEWLNAIAQNSSFSHVLLADESGEAVTESGTHLNIGDRGYFRLAMNGERVFQHLEDTRLDAGCDTVIGVPVEADGKTQYVLLGAYQAKDVFHLFMQGMDDDGAYAAILDSKGNIITASDEIMHSFEKNEVLQRLATLDFAHGYDADEIMESFIKHRTTSFEVMFHGKKYYVVAEAVSEESLHINDWYILNIVPTMLIRSTAGGITETYGTSVIIIMLLSLALMTFVVLQESEYRKRMLEEADELRMQGEAYSVAALLSEQYVVRYYFAQDNIVLEERVASEYGVPPVLNDIADFITNGNIFSPESKERAIKYYELIKSGAAEGSEQFTVYSPKSDAYRMMAWSFVTIFDKDEEPHHSIIVFRDITEEKMAEGRFRALATQADNFYRVRKDAALLNLSQNRIERLAEEISRELHCGEDAEADDFLHCFADNSLCPEDKKQYLEAMSRSSLLEAFQDGKNEQSWTFRFTMPDGSLRWRRANVRMAQNPTTDDVIAYLWTEDIHAEHQLTALLNTLVIEDYDFILLIDSRTSSIIKAVSQDNSFLEDDIKLGYEEMLRRRSRAMVTSEDQQRALEELQIPAIEETLKTQKRYELFYDVRGENREKLHKKTSCFYLDEQSRSEIVITRVDVTEAVQDQQRENDALSSALAEAERATAAKSEFLSRISHDMRTPMNAVLGFADLGAETQDVAELKDYMKKIGDSGRYLLTLINDTLSMTKIESGSLTLEYSAVNFEMIYELVNSVIRPKAEEKGVHFEVESKTEGVHTLMMDRLRMEQILVNLLGNAVKFTPAGGLVKLSVETLQNKPESACVRYVVSDNGAGMSEAFQKKMYKPFEQEHASAEGTGLGLSIAKQLVEMMGGSITVQSAPGKGTTFTIDIEYKKTEEQAEVENKAKTDIKTALAGMRVLLAEDHPST